MLNPPTIDNVILVFIIFFYNDTKTHLIEWILFLVDISVVISYFFEIILNIDYFNKLMCIKYTVERVRKIHLIVCLMLKRTQIWFQTILKMKKLLLILLSLGLYAQGQNIIVSPCDTIDIITHPSNGSVSIEVMNSMQLSTLGLLLSTCGVPFLMDML